MMSVDYRSFLTKTEASSEDGEYPFWGYFDLFVIIGICLPARILRSLSLGIFLAAPRMRVAFNAGAAVALADQSILYLVFCGIVALWFRVQHDRPFWRSIGMGGDAAIVPPHRPLWTGNRLRRHDHRHTDSYSDRSE